MTAVEERPSPGRPTPSSGAVVAKNEAGKTMVEVKSTRRAVRPHAGGQAKDAWAWLGLLQRPRKVHMRQLLDKSSATRALGLSKRCAPRRLAPTSLLLDRTLPCANAGSWFMRPHKGGGLDSGISPEFLSDPGDGRVARLAEDARHGLGSGVAWRTRCQGRSRIRDSQIIENHSQAFEQKYAAVGRKTKNLPR